MLSLLSIIAFRVVNMIENRKKLPLTIEENVAKIIESENGKDKITLQTCKAGKCDQHVCKIAGLEVLVFTILDSLKSSQIAVFHALNRLS